MQKQEEENSHPGLSALALFFGDYLYIQYRAILTLVNFYQQLYDGSKKNATFRKIITLTNKDGGHIPACY